MNIEMLVKRNVHGEDVSPGDELTVTDKVGAYLIARNEAKAATIKKPKAKQKKEK